MNACTTITAAPFEIGQGLINSSGRRAWIVAIDPVDNQGGPIRDSNGNRIGQWELTTD